MEQKLPAVEGPLERQVRQRTAWFDPRTNPIRNGAYEVLWRYGKDDDMLFFNRWDGRRWHWGYEELCAADMKIHAPARKNGNPQMVGWRGLCLPNVRVNLETTR